MSIAGDKIKVARLQAKLTLKELAGLYDYLAAATAWHWENQSWRQGYWTRTPGRYHRKN